jgi:hypothetical protein
VLAAGLLFAIPYAANIGTRFLLPALPFVALAMGMAVAESAVAATVLILAHAIFSWPAIVGTYCPPNAWRLLDKVPIPQALRIETEESYLNFRMPHYSTARMIDRLVPPDGKVLAMSGVPEAYTSREILVAYQSAFGNTLKDILFTPVLGYLEPNWRLKFQYPSQRLRRIRAVQTASGTTDQWSVTELRIFRGDVELPRAPSWKLRASPNPWGVQLAFDNSPVTRWRSWQTLYSGMYVAVEFGEPERSDAVILECTHDQYTVRVKLEGMDEAGKWKTLADAPQTSDAPNQFGLRRAAIEEVKQRGVGYLLMYDFDYGAKEFQEKYALWGVTLLGENNGARLYRLD